MFSVQNKKRKEKEGTEKKKKEKGKMENKKPLTTFFCQENESLDC